MQFGGKRGLFEVFWGCFGCFGAGLWMSTYHLNNFSFAKYFSLTEYFYLIVGPGAPGPQYLALSVKFTNR